MGTIKVSKKEREGGNLQSQNINSEVYHLRGEAAGMDRGTFQKLDFYFNVPNE